MSPKGPSSTVPFLAVLLTLGLLTACTGPEEPSPVSTTLEGTAAPSIAEVGATITEDEAEDLPHGQKSYKLPSGELVVVDRLKPLPPAVAEDIDQRASDTIPEPDFDSGEHPATAADELAVQVRTETAKYVAVIFRSFSYECETDDGFIWVTTVDVEDPTCDTAQSADGVRALVEEYLQDALGGPEAWHIISM